MPRAARFPIVTLALTALVVAAFLGVMDQGLPAETAASGAPPARQWVYLFDWNVWNGGYWSLLTAPLTHANPSFLLAFAHLALSLAGLWIFGWRIELTLGHEAAVALLFFGALVSSACALAAGQWPALGCTGMTCALVGAMHATWRGRFSVAGAAAALERARQEPGALDARDALAGLFRARVDLRASLAMLGWLVVAFLCGVSGLLFVSNAAHLGGWALGYCMGKAFYSRRPAKRRLATVAGCVAGLGALAALTVMSACWAPWNQDWRLWRFGKLAKAGQVQAALADAKDLTRRHPDLPDGLNAIAWTLATSPQDAVRDGPQAVVLARKACALTRWTAPEYIDTLAVAYAESGQWDQALRMERLAMRVAQSQSWTVSSSDYLNENMAQIQKRRPIRD